jgi:hypothetical protein
VLLLDCQRQDAASDHRPPGRRPQFSSLQTIWTPDQSHRFAPSASPSSSSSAPTIDIPVRFIFPQMTLPPSFQGGSRQMPLTSRRRQVDGDEVARVVYFVKLHCRKASSFSRDDRLIFPIIYVCVPSSISSLYDCHRLTLFAVYAGRRHSALAFPTRSSLPTSQTRRRLRRPGRAYRRAGRRSRSTTGTASGCCRRRACSSSLSVHRLARRGCPSRR